jgi:hypothetical protein
MPRWATLLLLCAACPQKAAAPTATAASPQSCLDRELAAKGLNSFGDPEGTQYAGGTPLFDERGGRTTPREEYVYARRPEIARLCAADAGR